MNNNAKGVTIKNLSKIYPGHKKGVVKAVDNISVDIKPGEFVTLLGPSGCGKTTTLRMIAGFEDISLGEIYLGDTCINSLSPDKRDTAMVFQSYALFPNYNVYDNIAYGLNIRKVPAEEMKKRVTDIIRLVGLEGLEDRQINQISGGQQQRVALARALVVEPCVLLFDEPLSNLDARLRIYMRTEIRKIQKKLSITALYVTHDQSEAMSLSDRIIILKDGRIVQVGTPKEVYYHPADKFVANFIGTANFLDGTILNIKEGRADVEINGITLSGLECHPGKSKGETCSVVVRPESMEISDDDTGLPCKVVLSTFMGSYQYYEVIYNQTPLQIHQYNCKTKNEFKEEEGAFIKLDNQDLYVL